MNRKEGLISLQQSLLGLNPAGTLERLREVAEKFNLDSAEDLTTIYDLVGLAHMAGFNLAEPNGYYAALYFQRSGNLQELEELKRLAALYGQHQTMNLLAPEKSLLIKDEFDVVGDPIDVDLKFRNFCKRNNLVIIDTMQKGISSIRRCSWVYLVWDTDGIVKVYKQILNYNRGTLTGIANREDELYSRLPDNPYFPKFLGVVEVSDISFAKFQFHYGHNLGRYLGDRTKFNHDSVEWLIRGLAQILQFLHEHDTAFLDMKADNILVEADHVKLLDLGISRLTYGNTEVDVYLADPFYGTPEVGTRLKAGKASDIYQLGILYYRLLYSKHPFEQLPFFTFGGKERESAILRYFWPTIVLCKEGVNTGTIIDDMLANDPYKRPTAKDLVTDMKPYHTYFSFPYLKPTGRKKENNTVLFPARMSIPHKGYIEYISRLLHLGFYVCIAIEHAYTITTKDPIQKSFVMKILAQSLIREGFSPNRDFEFIFAPLFETQTELYDYYMHMPLINDVIAIASGNPQVHELFSNFGVFDQKSVFGTEGEEWEIRSWGEALRKAIREEDQSTFAQYAALGVTQIISLQEIKAIYDTPHIEFTKTVEVVISQNGEIICTGPIQPYSSSDESAILLLGKAQSKNVRIIDLYSRQTIIEIDSQIHTLQYVETKFDPETLHETIIYNLHR